MMDERILDIQPAVAAAEGRLAAEGASPDAGVTHAAAPAVEVDGYSFAYEGTDRRVLQDVTFSLAQGAFAVLCGVTGSGKSTLLRALKPELSVAGVSEGSIRILGDDPAGLAPAESARRVGFVMQDPENQLVTDTVWHELAFGLENIAMETETMRRRVAETAHFFGIGSWFDRKVADLSGGQKQLLNLASVVVMQPQVLVLDEPTSQLDPIAAKDFFDVLGRINAELGITVVIIEHRLEDVLPMADRVLFLEKGGRLAFDGPPAGFIEKVVGEGISFAAALPAATRIAARVPHGDAAPVTVREGRAFLQEAVSRAGSLGPAPGATVIPPDNLAVKVRDLWFRYGKDEPFVLRGVDFDVHAGRVAAIVGGNGSGKSTLLSAIAGVRRPERGKIKNLTGGRVALMAQDPKMLFVRDRLDDDLLEWGDFAGYGKAEVDDALERFGLSEMRGRHPYDLSGGETQKAALAKILLLNPDVLLLDEPVKGIDAVAKRQIAGIMRDLALVDGKAVLFTAHDLEFVSEMAHTCSMMFGCEVTCTQDCRGFFQDNLFYSTATSRIARGILDGCVTTDDIAEMLANGESDSCCTGAQPAPLPEKRIGTHRDASSDSANGVQEKGDLR